MVEICVAKVPKIKITMFAKRYARVTGKGVVTTSTTRGGKGDFYY